MFTKNFYLLIILVFFCSIVFSANPVGYLENISNNTLTGWACDPDSPNTSINVRFTIGWPNSDEGCTNTDLCREINVTANQTSESAVNARCGGGTAHRFSYTLTNDWLNNFWFGNYEVKAYGANIGAGTETIIENSGQNLHISALGRNYQCGKEIFMDPTFTGALRTVNHTLGTTCLLNNGLGQRGWNTIELASNTYFCQNPNNPTSTSPITFQSTNGAKKFYSYGNGSTRIIYDSSVEENNGCYITWPDNPTYWPHFGFDQWLHDLDLQEFSQVKFKGKYKLNEARLINNCSNRPDKMTYGINFLLENKNGANGNPQYFWIVVLACNTDDLDTYGCATQTRRIIPDQYGTVIYIPATSATYPKFQKGQWVEYNYDLKALAQEAINYYNASHTDISINNYNLYAVNLLVEIWGGFYVDLEAKDISLSGYSNDCVNTPPPLCASFTYSGWSDCVNGNQTRNITSRTPTGCTEGNPILTQTCVVNQTPKGNVNDIVDDFVHGYACDPDDYSQAIAVHFYSDGPSGGGGTFIGSATANVEGETAIGTECGGNRNHRFVFPIPSDLKDGQAHTIYAYAINEQEGTNPLLGGAAKTYFQNNQLVQTIQIKSSQAKQFFSQTTQQADPFILKTGSTYYMYFTDQLNNIPIYQSTDMLNWTRMGNAFAANNILVSGKKQWENVTLNASYSYYDMWSPKLFYDERTSVYIMSFSANQRPPSTAGEFQTVWEAYSSSPIGPFGPNPSNTTRMHEPVPVRNYRWGFDEGYPHSEPRMWSDNTAQTKHIRLDGYIFKDGTDYWMAYTWFHGGLNGVNGNDMAMTKLDSSDLSLISRASPETYQLTEISKIKTDYLTGRTMYNHADGGENALTATNTGHWGIQEGSLLYKRNNKYYLFYAANAYNSQSYSVFYKMADTIRCLGLNSQKNDFATDPISGAQCNIKHGIAFDGIYNSNNQSYGVGSIVTGLDGQQLLQFIGVMQKNNPSIRETWLVEQQFNAQGIPITVSPTENSLVSIKKPNCTAINYSTWSACTNGTRTRTINSTTPTMCYANNAQLSEPCNTTNGTLSVTSTPSGANVYVNDILKGTTSSTALAISLAPGTYTVKLTKTDYNNYTTTKTITTNTTTTLSATLTQSSTTCTLADWDCDSWIPSVCPQSETQTRNCNKLTTCTDGVTPNTTQTCNYVPPCTENDWTCTPWSPTICTDKAMQTRNCTKNITCEGGFIPTTSQTCTYTPTCVESDWTSQDGECQSNNKLTRSWNIINNCINGTQHPATESVDCVYQTPTCTSFTYNSWTPTICPPSATQTRTIATQTPTGCQGGNPLTSQSCVYVRDCVDSDWTHTDGACQSNNTLTRSWTRVNTDCNTLSGANHSATESISCIYQAPACTSFTYNDWVPAICPQSGNQTRTIATRTPTNCQGGNPLLSQTCIYVPTCTATDWTLTDGACTDNNTLMRTWSRVNNCINGVQHNPLTETVSCIYNAPTCTTFTYSDWAPEACPQSGVQTKTITTRTPNGCQGGNPESLARSCTYVPTCTDNHWNYSDGACQSSNILTRTWRKIVDCNNGVTHPLTENVSCTYNAPQCIYSYTPWGACISGIQTRNYTLTNAPCNGSPTASQGCNTIQTCTANHWSYSLSECSDNNTQVKTWTKTSDCNAGIQHPVTEVITCLREQPRYCGNNDWNSRIEPTICPSTGTQTKYWTRTNTNCQGGITHNAQEIINCTYINPNPPQTTCTSFTYSDWSTCVGGTQTRTIITSFPSGCTGGNPETLTQNCTETPTCNGTTCNNICYEEEGKCCNNIWNSGVENCSYTIDQEIIQRINDTNDQEAMNLLEQAQTNLTNGNIEQGIAQARVAEARATLTTKTDSTLEEKYQQALTALENQEYKTANQLATEIINGENGTVLDQTTTLIILIAGAIVLFLILAIAARKRPPQNKQTKKYNEQTMT